MISPLTLLLLGCYLANLTLAKSLIHIPALNDDNIKNGLRIVGGEDATNVSIPWMVSLVLFGNHFCGGAIISRTTIVTAAHCLEIANKRYLKVRVGTKNRYDGGFLLPIQNYITHKDYGEDFHNDIGLIYLKKDLTFIEGIIQPIALPEPDSFVKDGTLAMVSGWGILRHDSRIVPKILQYVMVPVINREACNDLMENLITDTQLCAGYPEGGKDACQQDSGGPLVHNKKLIGIVSWGFECGKSGRPGVYTDVAVLTNWILEHMLE